MPKIENFKKVVREFYKKHKRKLLWREKIAPYAIFVSEIMLQQTQVSRVKKKFPEFIRRFPDFKSLAQASIKDVLTVWQGMGYNRRALYLKKSAEVIIKKYKGILPNNPHILETLPGVGKATASSISAFTWNTQTIFIETNIRRVFIHHFFSDKKSINDKDIIPLVKKTLDKKNPREWYYALMDYGSHLPKVTKNPNIKSKHYVKRSRFKGSNREIRGVVLRSVLKKPISINELEKLTRFDKKRLYHNLLRLQKEGFVMEKKGKYFIK